MEEKKTSVKRTKASTKTEVSTQSNIEVPKDTLISLEETMLLQKALGELVKENATNINYWQAALKLQSKLIQQGQILNLNK
jgi:hypothetical protein